MHKRTVLTCGNSLRKVFDSLRVILTFFKKSYDPLQHAIILMQINDEYLGVRSNRKNVNLKRTLLFTKQTDFSF